MDLKNGDKVQFYYDVYEVFNNVDFEFDRTELLNGTIKSYDNGNDTYVIIGDNNYVYKVNVSDIVDKESEERKAWNEFWTSERIDIFSKFLAEELCLSESHLRKKIVTFLNDKTK